MKYCPIHNVDFKHKVGMKEDGSGYDFWACPIKTETGFCKEKGVEKPEQSAQPLPSNTQNDEVRGKVRNSVAVAFIGQGYAYDANTVSAMEQWVDYIMKGLKA